jgi:MoxR-like ATPase
MIDDALRQPAEVRYAEELDALAKIDDGPRPKGWKLSPRMVLRYVVGTDAPIEVGTGKKKAKISVARKFFGDDSLVERAIVTLASERALLLVGEPGTGKSWLSEHLAAAISGCSTLTLQGTAGTTEEHVKYSWNVARVIAEGPTPQNLVPSPTMLAMRGGGLLRFEEITRCVPDVQDALVSVLSDKAIAVPELPDANMVWARAGFNVIATANTRDQGVNDLSAALKRRFNYVYLPVVGDAATEIRIVRERSRDLLERYAIDATLDDTVLGLLTTVFREIRAGKSAEGVQIAKPSTTLSTAEAIGVALDSAISARFFGTGTVGPEHVARNLIGSIVKEDRKDLDVLKEYLGIIAKKRALTDAAWRVFHDAAMQAVAEG